MPRTNSQVRSASSRHTTPTPAAISLGRIALPQFACGGNRLSEISAGQGVEECDDCLGLVVGQRSVELRIAHRFHRLRQCGRASVVKIRRSDRYIAQAWDPYDLWLRRSEGMKYPMALEHVS